MRGRRPSRLVVAASVVVLAAALATARFVQLRTPNRLGPEVSETAVLGPGPVGHRITAFLFGFYPHGRDPVRVRAVRITGVPDGIRIVAIHGSVHVGGSIHGEPDPNDLRPVTDITFREGEPEPWRIAVVVEAVKPGRWQTTGLDVAWQAGRHKGTTHFKYAVGMEVRNEDGP